ncbi:toll/interleukin-1 receptor domain-containing protein [Mesorhizobium sp. M00.F.Ca.ET.217.01.1.1]|uniref:toll/interleukin-1 receptor domain-containing protein n=1 Tax=Mesorhizobium sp. M00.F.Ca.ET.217.01.1.1 TaxID=2500529 RepID=UPI000FD7BC89|nr:toll/interleukin-1 receptor domain-containing protein [Mesorhizobium sp. M00.F.Ca.ET.217.01.1.1]TGQ13582.1 toll/interleukin-1 receptor domain-containing protein [Mesorhizobium sp. M00.F.Ca.ET.217.01.1.1]TGV85446.1 toll/interleukin-1 receptor domain-containing protein [Mesorhizobium sp. M00.F.Ca.ET.158.01.1.1]
MTYKNRPFSGEAFSNDLEAAVLQNVKDQLQARFGAIRHPETGEFPTVVVNGRSLDDMRLTIEGSPALLSIVRERMDLQEQQATTFLPSETKTPKAFLSYSFDDRDLAEIIARRLVAEGIETWWAEWEISAGDSLRRKIDEGLGNCTHFIVLLTPNAMKKPWVQQEMDAGLVRKIAGQARFIPLRHGLAAQDLPPLLSGVLSPEVDQSQLDDDLRDLVNDIHGVSRKPPLGAGPTKLSAPVTGYSKTATAIAEIFVRETKQAMFGDPIKDVTELAETIDVSEDDIDDALHELRDLASVSLGRVLVEAALYSEFDKYFMEWVPETDAIRIAADLINDPTMPTDTAQVATRYGWEPRRMNPALAYLLARNLIVDYRVLSHDFISSRVAKTDDTRRFVKSRS